MMRQRLLRLMLIAALMILPAVLAGCGDDANAFQLDECRLNNGDCRLG